MRLGREKNHAEKENHFKVETESIKLNRDEKIKKQRKRESAGQTGEEEITRQQKEMSSQKEGTSLTTLDQWRKWEKNAHKDQEVIKTSLETEKANQTSN